MRTAVGDVQLSAATVESLELDVYCSSDPTGTAPEFAVTAFGTYASGSTTFTAGAWASTYGSDGWSTARTPTMGSSGSLAVTSGQRKWLWIKAVAGSETAIWLVGSVRAY